MAGWHGQSDGSVVSMADGIDGMSWAGIQCDFIVCARDDGRILGQNWFGVNGTMRWYVRGGYARELI